MPIVNKIIVYPIKSLDGVAVGQSQIQPGGSLRFDREFALFNAEGRTINGKKYPALHRVRTEHDLTYRLVTFSVDSKSNTFALHLDRSPIEEWFSDYLGLKVTLKQNTETGFPDDDERPGPTVISLASLQQVAHWFGIDVESARRRFRANIELAECPAFWEDQLFGAPGIERPFQLGGVELVGLKPCARCPVPIRDPDTGEAMPKFQQTFVQLRRETLPAFAHQAQFPHFYYLSVNTQIDASQKDKYLNVGDNVMLPMVG